MPRAFLIPQLPTLPSLAAESFIFPNGDVDPIICPEGDLWVPVVVGNLAGHYCIQKHKVVSADGSIYSPTGFECAGGKENNRKWRLSIRVLLPTGERGRTLGMWLVSHKFDHLTPQSSPRKSGSSYRSSEDTGGRSRATTGTTSSGFGSQGTGSLTLPGRPSPEKRYRSNDDDYDPSKDDASPSKMLRKAFFNAPTGNSLNIPEPTPPPLSPNPADVIGNFMQHHLAIHSPPNPSSLGLDPGINTTPCLPLPTRRHTVHNGAMPMQTTPPTMEQLQSLLLPLGASHFHPIPRMHAIMYPVGGGHHHHQHPPNHPPPGFGSPPFLSSHDAGEGLITTQHPILESFLAPVNNNTTTSNSTIINSTMNVANTGGNVISTGMPIFPSRVIGLADLHPEGNQTTLGGRNTNTNNNEVKAGGGEGQGRKGSDGNSEEPVLGRGARRRAGGGGGGEGQNKAEQSLTSHRRVAVPVAPAPVPEPRPRQLVYTQAPRPTAAALAAARAASEQHHVEAITPLHFVRQDSGSSLDLARVFDYGDFSPGGMTGFTPLQRSPGGGSEDWGGDVQSITFSLGGNNLHGQAQGNMNKSINNVEGGRGGGGGAAAKKIEKRASDASDSSFSIGKSTPPSPPPDMLDVRRPEVEAAAEEAAKEVVRAQKGGGLFDPLITSKDTRKEEFAVRGGSRMSLDEPTKKVSPRLAAAAAAAAAAGREGKEKESADDRMEVSMEISTEISSDSSNLAGLGDPTALKSASDVKKQKYPGLRA